MVTDRFGPKTAVAKVALGFVLTVIAGCGGDRGGLPEDVTGEGLIEGGIEAAEKGDCAAAVEKISAALKSGRVTVDLVDDALVARAKCHAAGGRYDEALADLDEAALGTPDPAAVHAARGEVLLAKGDKGLAKAEYAMAKKMNPKVAVPAELR